MADFEPSAGAFSTTIEDGQILTHEMKPVTLEDLPSLEVENTAVWAADGTMVSFNGRPVLRFQTLEDFQREYENQVLIEFDPETDGVPNMTAFGVIWVDLELGLAEKVKMRVWRTLKGWLWRFPWR